MTRKLLSNRGNPVASETGYDISDHHSNGPTENRIPLRQVHVLQSRPGLEKTIPSRERILEETIPLNLNETGGGIKPRSYSLVGTRGDVDFMLWTITDSLETLQAFHSDLLKT